MIWEDVPTAALCAYCTSTALCHIGMATFGYYSVSYLGIITLSSSPLCHPKEQTRYQNFSLRFIHTGSSVLKHNSEYQWRKGDYWVPATKVSIII